MMPIAANRGPASSAICDSESRKGAAPREAHRKGGLTSPVMQLDTLYTKAIEALRRLLLKKLRSINWRGRTEWRNVRLLKRSVHRQYFFHFNLYL